MPTKKPAKKQPTRKPKAKAKPKPKPKRDLPFAGQTWAFFGELTVWPSYHALGPEGTAAARGATITDVLDDRVDVVVFGDGRRTGRSEAKKKAAKLPHLEVLDEAAYRDLVKIDVRGKRFAFTGGFDCSPSGLDDRLLHNMVEAVGGVVTTDIDPTLDYLVVGNRRGEKKIATVNRVHKLIDGGASTKILDENAFLDLVRVERPTSTSGELDFATFLNQLYGYVDRKKLGRALDMLREDRFRLYEKHDDQHLVGVVRSQSGSGNVYASWLTFEGHYGCAQPDLEECMGLQGTICKHLLVLVVGLARTHHLPLAQALSWIRAAHGKPPRDNDTLCAETFIQYKGAEAGEVDWRPTETIPEDFYAL